jgi:glycine/D-amino acid oxidase-like deaminating enzyme/nitrite reductase/ring-hydroxylating ferredoxin subunit
MLVLNNSYHMGKTIKNSKIARDSFTESVWQEIEDNSTIIKNTIAEEVYDALIVGAGITGITTALLLQKAGKKVIVAEGNTLLFGTTSGTTAHLNTFFDATYPEIESGFGSDAAKQVAKVAKETLATIKALINEYQIDCDFEEKEGFLYSQNEKETKELTKILESSKKANVAVEEVETNGVPINFEHALKFDGQAQFHPVKYILKLAEEFQKLGGKLLENTFIRSTEQDENGLHIAKSDHLAIRTKNIVYATHIPPGINLLSLRCAPYRSYVLGIKLADQAYPTCLSYDMQEPYHYIRTHVIKGEKILILGGEDHKTGHAEPETSLQNLEDYARQYFQVEDIPYKWSAQYYTSADTLPYIGKMPAGEEGVYIATGFNGNGMQLGTLSAQIISDLILGKDNEYADLFNPSRIKPIAGFSEFVKENADVAYRFVADRFSAEEIASLEEIKPDEGKLVDFKDQKLAIYKSKTGQITALNPVCTHAKCIVNFNDEEKSWDCPCHGGRFDLNGKVLTGPPRHDLQQIDIESHTNR